MMQTVIGGKYDKYEHKADIHETRISILHRSLFRMGEQEDKASTYMNN